MERFFQYLKRRRLDVSARACAPGLFGTHMAGSRLFLGRRAWRTGDEAQW